MKQEMSSESKDVKPQLAVGKSSTPSSSVSPQMIATGGIPSMAQLIQVAPVANISDLIGLVATQLQNNGNLNSMALPLSLANQISAASSVQPSLLGDVAAQISSQVVSSGVLPSVNVVTSESVAANIGTPLSLSVDVGSPLSVATTELSVASPGDPLPSPASMDIPESSHPGGGKMKRRSTGREEKLICGVCGDKALGCNFDAISCESCKAFFRRNALKDKKTKCLFEGSCKIDVNTRRFCPHCRLKKCFTIGMKKEFILGEEERKRRMGRSGQAKDKKKITEMEEGEGGGGESSQNVSVEEVPSIPNTPLIATSTIAAPSVEPANDTETPTQVPPATATQVFNTPPAPPIQITLQIPPGSTESVNLLSLSRYIKSSENFNTPMDSYLVRRLTNEESAMLQELMQVYDLSFTVDLEPLIHLKQVDPSLNQLVNQSSVTVLRIIKFAKRLEEFVRLPQECQIGILKGCWINMLLLRSVSVYDQERDLWLTPRGEIPTEILKNATGFDRLHDDHVKYCKSIKSLIKDDLTIVVLLIVIALFAPEGPHVLTRELVSNIQDKYLVLLKHYLESKYMYARAAEMFPQLMSKMKELKELAEDHGKYLLDVNPKEIEPIMLEILDLQ